MKRLPLIALTFLGSAFVHLYLVYLNGGYTSGKTSGLTPYINVDANPGSSAFLIWTAFSALGWSFVYTVFSQGPIRAVTSIVMQPVSMVKRFTSSTPVEYSCWALGAGVALIGAGVLGTNRPAGFSVALVWACLGLSRAGQMLAQLIFDGLTQTLTGHYASLRPSVNLIQIVITASAPGFALAGFFNSSTLQVLAGLLAIAGGVALFIKQKPKGGSFTQSAGQVSALLLVACGAGAAYMFIRLLWPRSAFADDFGNAENGSFANALTKGGYQGVIGAVVRSVAATAGAAFGPLAPPIVSDPPVVSTPGTSQPLQPQPPPPLDPSDPRLTGLGMVTGPVPNPVGIANPETTPQSQDTGTPEDWGLDDTSGLPQQKLVDGGGPDPNIPDGPGWEFFGPKGTIQLEPPKGRKSGPKGDPAPGPWDNWNEQPPSENEPGAGGPSAAKDAPEGSGEDPSGDRSAPPDDQPPPPGDGGPSTLLQDPRVAGTGGFGPAHPAPPAPGIGDLLKRFDDANQRAGYAGVENPDGSYNDEKQIELQRELQDIIDRYHASGDDPKAFDADALAKVEKQLGIVSAGNKEQLNRDTEGYVDENGDYHEGSVDRSRNLIEERHKKLDDNAADQNALFDRYNKILQRVASGDLHSGAGLDSLDEWRKHVVQYDEHGNIYIDEARLNDMEQQLQVERGDARAREQRIQDMYAQDAAEKVAASQVADRNLQRARFVRDAAVIVDGMLLTGGASAIGGVPLAVAAGTVYGGATEGGVVLNEGGNLDQAAEAAKHGAKMGAITGLAGAAAGKVVGGVITNKYVAGALIGGTMSKATGGDFATGALLGAAGAGVGGWAEAQVKAGGGGWKGFTSPVSVGEPTVHSTIPTTPGPAGLPETPGPSGPWKGAVPGEGLGPGTREGVPSGPGWPGEPIPAGRGSEPAPPVFPEGSGANEPPLPSHPGGEAPSPGQASKAGGAAAGDPNVVSVKDLDHSGTVESPPSKGPGPAGEGAQEKTGSKKDPGITDDAPMPRRQNPIPESDLPPRGQEATPGQVKNLSDNYTVDELLKARQEALAAGDTERASALQAAAAAKGYRAEVPPDAVPPKLDDGQIDNLPDASHIDKLAQEYSFDQIAENRAKARAAGDDRAWRIWDNAYAQKGSTDEWGKAEYEHRHLQENPPGPLEKQFGPPLSPDAAAQADEGKARVKAMAENATPEQLQQELDIAKNRGDQSEVDLIQKAMRQQKLDAPTQDNVPTAETQQRINDLAKNATTDELHQRLEDAQARGDKAEAKLIGQALDQKVANNIGRGEPQPSGEHPSPPPPPKEGLPGDYSGLDDSHGARPGERPGAHPQPETPAAPPPAEPAVDESGRQKLVDNMARNMEPEQLQAELDHAKATGDQDTAKLVQEAMQQQNKPIDPAKLTPQQKAIYDQKLAELKQAQEQQQQKGIGHGDVTPPDVPISEESMADKARRMEQQEADGEIPPRPRIAPGNRANEVPIKDLDLSGTHGQAGDAAPPASSGDHTPPPTPGEGPAGSPAQPPPAHPQSEGTPEQVSPGEHLPTADAWDSHDAGPVPEGTGTLPDDALYDPNACVKNVVKLARPDLDPTAVDAAMDPKRGQSGAIPRNKVGDALGDVPGLNAKPLQEATGNFNNSIEDIQDYLHKNPGTKILAPVAKPSPDGISSSQNNHAVLIHDITTDANGQRMVHFVDPEAPTVTRVMPASEMGLGTFGSYAIPPP